MEGVAAVGLYAAENVLEGAAALYKGLTLSTAPLKATFTKLRAPLIPRSSHTISVVSNRAYVFGGEIAPRTPVDASMHVLTLPSTSLTECDYQVLPPKPDSDSEAGDLEVPAPRVGHTAAVIGNSIYVFGGRGGVEMAALEEEGRVWVFDTRTDKWSHLDPEPGAPFPPARSYHSSAASEHPDPSASSIPFAAPISTTTTNAAAPQAPVNTRPQDISHEPAPANTYGTLFVHAGCLSSGGRTSDVWSFDIASRTWSPLPSAPDPPRGGTSLVVVRDRLYRFGGFDGQKEVGGQIDWLDLNVSDTFTDKGGAGTMAISPRSQAWSADVFKPESVASGQGGNRTCPSNRSVAGFVGPLTTGMGREYCLIVCGEGEASTAGHAAAGRFLDDVWSFQLKPEGMTAGAIKDAARRYVFGAGTGEADVVEVRYFAGEGAEGSVSGVVGTEGGNGSAGVSLGESGGRMVQEGQKRPMGRRGWFACCAMGDAGGGNSVLVHGGVGEGNERLGDCWVVSVE